MPAIILTTKINAPARVCFDLSRSIDLHTDSMQHTREKAIAGITSGLIGLNQQVTWQADHFGIPIRMTVRITSMKSPEYFIDEMIKGPFKSMRHVHRFASKGQQTVMTDEFVFSSPLGIIGLLADKLFLKKYMTNLLIKRNQVIKTAAEAAVTIN